MVNIVSPWFGLAFVAALSTSITDTILKGALSKLGPGEMVLVRFLAPLPLLLPSIFLQVFPRLDFRFWLTLSSLVPLEILAMVLYMKALRISEMSLSIPMLAFTPSFIVVTGWLILGETVSIRGFWGIMSTVFGAYLLHLSPGKSGPFEPIRALLNHHGSRYMLAVSLIYSVTSCLGKRAILYSSPLFFAPFYFSFLGIIVPLFFSLYWKKNGLNRLGTKVVNGGIRMWGAVISIGILQSIMVYSHMLAISLSNAAYMIAVKRTSLLFSILFGAIFFKEGPLLPRGIGGIFMLLGVYLVATSK